MPQILVSTKVAAQYLGNHRPQTLEAWRRAGIGPVYVRVGPHAIRYSLEDLDAYIVAQKKGVAK